MLYKQWFNSFKTCS